MKISQIIFLSVLIIPFVEIYLLLALGDIVGILFTILLVVFTAILGAWLLRQQGFATFKRFQENLAKGTLPAYEMIEGPILLVGGALLLTPGFFTDIIGFACLIPVSRRLLAKYMLEKHFIKANEDSPFKSANVEPSALEGEYKRED